jgi:anti-anti-sigma regulatory factor
VHNGSLSDTASQSLPVILNLVKQVLQAPDETALQQLFSQVTIQPPPSVIVEAIANRRAAFADRVHRRRVEVVNQTNLALASALDEDNVLDILTRIDEVGQSAFAVLGYMTQTGKLALEVLATRVGSEWSAPVEAQPMMLLAVDDYPLLPHLISNPHRIIYCEDIDAGQDDLDDSSRAYFRLMQARSLLIMPFAMRDELIGVFSLFWAAPRVIPTPVREVFEAVHAITAATVANRRLMRGMEARFEQALMDLGTAQQDREQLQQQVIEAQQRSLAELSTPIIPLFDDILVMPLIGSIDTARARDVMRALLKGITDLRAKVVIIDITGVPMVDSGVAAHLNKTIQAARLKGSRTVLTGISDSVAETVVDLGIDWSGVDTERDLQSGLVSALRHLGRQVR